MRLKKQYKKESDRLEGVAIANTKHAYINAIKELIDSIYVDFADDGKLNWWSVVFNSGTILARVLAARKMMDKLG